MTNNQIIQQLRDVIHFAETGKNDQAHTIKAMESLVGAIEFDMDDEDEEKGSEYQRNNFLLGMSLVDCR